MYRADLYKKLASLKSENPELYSFNLLDTLYRHNPLHNIYSMVIYYIGDEIFSPSPTIDVTIRASKEIKLAERTRALTERIKPGQSLEHQKARALEMLQDVADDNAKLIKEDTSFFTAAISKVSFWGMSLSSMSLTSEGRLGRLIALAKITITGMTAKDFEPLLIDDSIEVSEPIVTKAPERGADEPSSEYTRSM